MIKRTWILSFIILVTLIIAMAFRWEHGPQNRIGNNIVVWNRDRWLNQIWIKTYNQSGVFETPQIPTLILEERKKQLYESPTYSARREELSNKLELLKNERMQLYGSYGEYIKLVNQNRKAQNPYAMPYAPNARYREYENGIPQKIIDEYQRMLDIMVEETKLGNELTKELPKIIEEQAKLELVSSAWRKRKNLTYIWLALVIISLIPLLIEISRHNKAKPEGRNL